MIDYNENEHWLDWMVVWYVENKKEWNLIKLYKHKNNNYMIILYIKILNYT